MPAGGSSPLPDGLSETQPSPGRQGPLGEQSCRPPHPDASHARKHPRGGSSSPPCTGSTGTSRGCAASWRVARELFPSWLQLSSTDGTEKPCCDHERSRGRAPLLSGGCPRWRVLPALSPPALLLCPLRKARLCKKRVGWDAASPTGLNPRSCVAPGTGTQSDRPGRKGSGVHGGGSRTGQKAPCVRAGAPAARKPARQRQPPRWGLKHPGEASAGGRADARLTCPKAGSCLRAGQRLRSPREGSGQSGQRRCCQGSTLTLFPALGCSQSDGRTRWRLSAGKP